jgi:hypothetical protein
MSHNQTQPVE